MSCLVTSYSHLRFELLVISESREGELQRFQMSLSSDSSSSSSGGRRRGKFLREIVEFSGIVPYDKDLEPLATPEEAAEHEACKND